MNQHSPNASVCIKSKSRKRFVIRPAVCQVLQTGDLLPNFAAALPQITNTQNHLVLVHLSTTSVFSRIFKVSQRMNVTGGLWENTPVGDLDALQIMPMDH